MTQDDIDKIIETIGGTPGEIQHAEITIRFLSEKPEGEPRLSYWQPSERVCEKCGSLMWQADWWDDDLENGGANIGTKYECGDCGEIDSD